MTPNIPIAAWTPDGDLTIPGVLSDVENMVPTRRGYAPEFALEASIDFAAAPPAEVIAAQTLRFVGGSVQPFLATYTNLYYVLAGGGGIVNISRATPAYSVAPQGYPWRFAAFSTPTNSDVLLAVQYGNTLQATVNFTSADFADVSSAPAADTIAVQRNFVILGNYNDGTQYENGWICSAQEDYTDWTPDIATQSAKGLLTATPGKIVRLIAFRDYVVAFKAYSMYRGTYVGAAANTWSWPVVSNSVGIVHHDAVCEADGRLFWLAFDGFYTWSGGAIERIRSAPFEWLLDQTGGAGFLGLRAQSVYDPVRRVVRWSFTIPGGILGVLMLTYHIDTDRWGKAELPASLMFTLPSVAGPSVLSGAEVSTNMAPAYISIADNSILEPTGEPDESSFTTGDIGDDDETFSLTKTRVRFWTAPTTSTATHSTRESLDDPLTVRSAIARSDGKYDLSHAARWHRVKFAQTGRYEVAGYRVEMPKAGRR